MKQEKTTSRIFAIEAEAILDNAGFDRWGRPKKEINPRQNVFDYTICRYIPTINEVYRIKNRVARHPHYRA